MGTYIVWVRYADVLESVDWYVDLDSDEVDKVKELLENLRVNGHIHTFGVNAFPDRPDDYEGLKEDLDEMFGRVRRKDWTPRSQ